MMPSSLSLSLIRPRSLSAFARSVSGPARTRQSVWLWASGDADAILKDPGQRKIASENRRLNDRQLGWLDALAAKGQVSKRFKSVLFSSGVDLLLVGLVGLVLVMGAVLSRRRIATVLPRGPAGPRAHGLARG